MLLFPIIIKIAVAIGVFWLISPKGKLTSAVRWGRRVGASFLVALIVAYPFVSYSVNEWKVLALMVVFAWGAGFAAGWLAGLVVLRLRARQTD